jgi:hypothetical protein
MHHRHDVMVLDGVSSTVRTIAPSAMVSRRIQQSAQTDGQQDENAPYRESKDVVEAEIEPQPYVTRGVAR